MMKVNGFTLIEMLVVISIIGVIGVIFSQIFYRSIQASDEVQVVNKMKQSGQSVLDILSGEIRGADRVACPGGINASPGKYADNVLIIIKYNSDIDEDQYFKYTFNPAVSGISNGTFTKELLDISGLADPTTICNSQISQNPSLLTDDNPQTGVSIGLDQNEDDIFTRTVTAGQLDSVAIAFQVLPAVNSPKGITQNVNPIPFETIIGLR